MQVLIVDDSQVIRMLVAESVLGLTHEIIHLGSSAEAVEYIKMHSPYLIMTDVEMPKINGCETTRQIKAIKGEDWFSYNRQFSSADEMTKPANAVLYQVKDKGRSRVEISEC
jgi:CheY-like chemotaxis protein